MFVLIGLVSSLRVLIGFYVVFWLVYYVVRRNHIAFVSFIDFSRNLPVEDLPVAVFVCVGVSFDLL